MQASYESCKVFFSRLVICTFDFGSFVKLWSIMLCGNATGSFKVRSYKVQCGRTEAAEESWKLDWEAYNW